jgi:hypothetical protein
MGSTARQTHMQDVHFLRASFALADLASGTLKIGTLPAGARVLNTDLFIETAFNAATTNVLDVGFAGTIGAFLPTGTAVAGTTGQKTSKPSALTGVIAADTDVNVTFSQTGTAATTGSASVVIQYAPNN